MCCSWRGRFWATDTPARAAHLCRATSAGKPGRADSADGTEADTDFADCTDSTEADMDSADGTDSTEADTDLARMARVPEGAL
jgi:hypothetical protein